MEVLTRGLQQRVWLPRIAFTATVLTLCLSSLGLDTALAQARSAYAGDWEFTFSGRDSGSGRFKVESDGHIRGRAHFQAIVERQIDGIVEDSGVMDWDVAGAEFVGKADPNGNAVGTWRNSGNRVAGSWSAKRIDPITGSGSKRRKQK